MSTFLQQVLQANVYVQPVQFTLVLVTNLLNIRVLCSRVLRSSPCTYYFLIYSVASIVYNCLVCPTQFLRGLRIDWANTLVGCKIHYYIIFLPPFVARVMLVLASFDRYCSSSKSRRLYSASTKRTASITILSSVITSMVYMSPMSVIYYYNTTTGICLQYSDLPVNIYIFSQIILFYILAPLSMIIFGILTIVNIHQNAARAVAQTAPTQGRRTEGQLARMLLLQISAHLVLTVPFGVIYFMNAFDPSTRTPKLTAVRLILVIWQQCEYFVSFFLYVLSGSIYREQLLHLFKFTKHVNRQIHPNLPQQTGRIHNLPITKISVHPTGDNNHEQS